MIRRPFFSLMRPKLKCVAIEEGVGDLTEVGLPARVTLLAGDCDIGSINLKAGTAVRTGEKLRVSDDVYIISTVTGTISAIGEYTGYLSQGYVSISIDVTGEDQWDDGTLDALKEPGFDVARDYLACIPGKADFSSLLRSQPPVNTLVVTGVDQDLLVLTNQRMVLSEDLSAGIEYLKKVTRSSRVILAVGPGFSLADIPGVDVLAVRPVYPGSLPAMIARDVLGSDYIAGRSFQELGIGFLGAEAVLSLSGLFDRGEFPVDKVITVIGKDGSAELVKARIGTSVKDILDVLGIETSHGDRVVLGGPMTGKAIYSEDMPILADTDAILVQDRSQVVLSEDVQCVNCGECVRACPVGIPVNMLVRLLGRSLYEEAAEQYDLHSCIECGLCNYVCVARIPVFHHIMLGKQEYFRLKNLEGTHA
jgi:electron transport complex protein RnfC